jgi:hypothetical protein
MRSGGREDRKEKKGVEGFEIEWAKIKLQRYMRLMSTKIWQLRIFGAGGPAVP